ncbi:MULTISPECIES: endonuclease domain-containing protein [unclassified Mesorhizobium]|uniref:endonuclease domain-containing protein n=1 Tax=unclassified Mesorhizobium TaxID=325217 RepID=UPI000AC00B49|nr:MULTISPECIES: DUF559 domain-containing protein [unclassified Mesorhizobium]
MGVLGVSTAIDPKVIPRARRLRRNMTEGERKLWAELSQFRRWYGIHIRKQAPIGYYVVDFVIHEHRLVMEVDGEHHFTPEGQRRDRERDEWLAGEGYTVLRFNTGELSDNFSGCIEEILGVLGLMDGRRRTPTPNPSPQGGGGLG